MKIAVASMTGQDLSQHFGRSRCFVVFTIENGKITHQEIRNNPHAHHHNRQHPSGLSHHSSHHSHAPHSHADLIQTLHDCQLVFCAGMGPRAARDLQAAGIQPLIVSPTAPIQELIEQFLTGRLQGQLPSCDCGG